MIQTVFGLALLCLITEQTHEEINSFTTKLLNSFALTETTDEITKIEVFCSKFYASQHNNYFFVDGNCQLTNS